MKRIIFLIIITTTALQAFAQNPYWVSVNNYQKIRGLWADSIFKVSTDTTFNKLEGSLAYRNGALYVKTSTKWSVLSLSSSGVISFNGRTGVVVPNTGDYALQQLNDVYFNSLHNGQALVYDSISLRWHNATITGGGGTIIDTNALTLQKAYDKSIAAGQIAPFITTTGNGFFVRGIDAAQRMSAQNSSSGNIYTIGADAVNNYAYLLGNTNYFRVYDDHYRTNLATGSGWGLVDTAGNGNLTMQPLASAGDTSSLSDVIDTTLNAGQPILWAQAHKIKSSKKLLFDNTHTKVVIGSNQISDGGNTNQLYIKGNQKTTGADTANSFVKIGGTSSQFLKADGSVDANTYIKDTSNLHRQDSINALNIAAKLNISDTASMLSPYAKKNYVDAGLASKLNVSDTLAMLLGYINLVTGENYLSRSGHTITANPVNLSNTNVAGNLPVSHLNSGTGASSTTFWRGDGIWATPPGGGGGSGIDTSSFINPNMFSGSDYSRLQQATDYARVRNKTIYIGWNNNRNSRLWLLDTAVLFQSHCNYMLVGCTIQRSDSSWDNIFRSANIGYGLTNPSATPYTDVSFIGSAGASIKGADNPTSSGDAYQTLSTNATSANGFSFGTYANRPDKSHKGGWFNNLIQIGYVSNLIVSNITVVNSNAYGITMGYCSNAYLENIHAQNYGYANGDTTRILHNQGTIDFHQSYNNIYVLDVDGFSQDDVIALNTLNKDSAAGHYGYYPEGDTISFVRNTNINICRIHAGSNNNVVRFILPPGTFYTKGVHGYDIENTLKPTDPFFGTFVSGTYASVISLGESQGSGIGGNISWGQWDDFNFSDIRTSYSTYLIQVKNRLQNSRFFNLYKPNATATAALYKSGSFADFKNVYSTRIDSVNGRQILASKSGIDLLAVDSSNSLYTTEIGGSAMKLAQWNSDKAVSFGKGALLNNTTGGYNTAFGTGSLQSNVTGSYVTAAGYNSAYSSTGGYLTAIGYFAGYSTTSGQQNVFIGHQTGYSNTSGNDNVAGGHLALFSNQGGSGNISFGTQSLYTNTGSYNVAIGDRSLRNQGNASYNTAIGYYTLNGNTTGTYNVAIGANSLQNNTTASFNIAIGQSAMVSNTTGQYNIALGNAISGNTTGSYNIGIGTGTNSGVSTTNGNVAVGFRGNYTGSGTGNTAFGDSAGYNHGTGSYNTSIGSNTGPAVSTNLSNTGAFGYNARPTFSNQLMFGNASIIGLWLGNSAASVQQVSTTTSINLAATGTTTLFTVPTGRTMVITGAIVHCTAASGITTGATVNFYTSSAGDVYASQSMATLTTSGQDWGFSTVGLSKTIAASGTVTFSVTTAAAGGTQTASVDLIYYLK